jgi:hypothetical protein
MQTATCLQSLCSCWWLTAKKIQDQKLHHVSRQVRACTGNTLRGRNSMVHSLSTLTPPSCTLSLTHSASLFLSLTLSHSFPHSLTLCSLLPVSVTTKLSSACRQRNSNSECVTQHPCPETKPILPMPSAELQYQYDARWVPKSSSTPP